MISAMNMISLGGDEGEELREKHGSACLEDFLSDDNVCQSKFFKAQLLSFEISVKTHHKPYQKFSVHESSSI